MDYDAQRMALAERLRQAQAMQQAQVPQGQMVGRIYVPPAATQYLATGLKQYLGAKGAQDVMKEQTALGEKQQTAIAEALRNFGQKAQGAPAQPTGQTFQTGANEMGDEAATVPQWAAAQKPDMMGAYQALLQAPDTQLRNAGMQGMLQMPQIEAQQAERQENRDFRRSEREALAAQRMQELQQNHQLRLQQMQEQNASRQQMAEEQRAHQRAMAELTASLRSQGGGAQPYFQPVQTGQGVMAFNARTGRVEPVMGTDGRPIVGAAADPTLQGQIAGAKTAATSGVEQGIERGKAVKKSEQMLTALDQAESLLKQGPTQSGIGAAADTAARFAGITTKGAQTAGQLETLSGWLVANVPRMEGPQSNFDVQNYTTMAGMVGDRNRPIAERMAALKTVRELQQKYKEFNQEPAPSATSGTGNKRIKYDAQGNPIP